MSPMLLALFLCLPLPSGTAGAVRRADDPSIHLEKKEYDFGSIMQNEEKKVSIRVTNRGGAPLLIKKITNSCGCAIPERWRNVTLSPGESRVLTITLSGKRDFGRLRKNIKIYSNDPVHPEVTCWVELEVKADYFPEKRAVTIENLRPGMKAAGSILIRNFMKTPLLFTEIRPNAPWIQARLVPLTGRPVGKKTKRQEKGVTFYRLEVEVDGSKVPAARNRLTGRILCKTNAPSMKEDAFLVVVHLTGEVKAEPERVLFPPVLPGEHKSVRIHLTHLKGRRFLVSRISCNSPFVSCTVEKVQDVGAVVLRATFSGKARTGMIRGEIRVFFDGHNDAPLVIPFSGLVRPASPLPADPGKGKKSKTL